MTVRVLQIIPTLVQNGAEKQLTMLATGLPRDEFDVHVCVLTRDGPLRGELDAAGVPVTVIGVGSNLLVRDGGLAAFHFRVHRIANSRSSQRADRRTHNGSASCLTRVIAHGGACKSSSHAP